MAEEVCESQLSIFLLGAADLFRRPNRFKKGQEHFFEDVMVFDLRLDHEGDGSEEVLALVQRVEAGVGLATCDALCNVLRLG